MAKGLTAEEIRSKIPEAIQVGQGMDSGLIVLQVHKGHIVNTYREVRVYAPKGGADDREQDQ